MTPDEFKSLPVVTAALEQPRSVRSVLNYICACNTSDPVMREQLSMDDHVRPLLGIWFTSGVAMDGLAQAFVPVIRELAANTLNETEWQSVEGKAARVFLADQVSRNAFRDSAECFAYDPIALELMADLTSKERQEATLALPAGIIYLLSWALAHSEALPDLVRAVDLTKSAMAVYPNFTLFERNLSAIQQHRDVLAHFGRYPQRNARLGRQNTSEEQAWLDDVENLPIWAGGKGGPFGKVIFQE
jgi:uncharacterized protein (DUF924 family)